MKNNPSEVARIRAQIEAEITSMNLLASGLAAGVARHKFITARMERLGEQQAQLAQHIGEEQALWVVYQTYTGVMTQEEKA